MRRFNVFGLKRSGQHAIIEWIANHFEGPVFLANNCIAWPPNHKLTNVFHVDKAARNEMREIESKAGREVYEGPRIYTAEDPGRKHQLRDLPIEGHTNVFIIRSFWNNAASRMRIGDHHSAGWDPRFVDWWADLARLYIAYSESEGWSNAWFIHYDGWTQGGHVVRDVDRAFLGLDEKLGSFADTESRKTAHKGYGGNVGSSFFKWGDRGDETRRYELALKADERFQKLVANVREDVALEQCRELNKQIFGWTLDREGNRV